MATAGKMNMMTMSREVDFGVYLSDGTDEILLPKRYVPAGLKEGDELEVFVYHDNEGRLIATTDKPLAVLGEIVMLEVSTVTSFGAFLKWGIMKDVFCPIALQGHRMRPGDKRLVYLFTDEQTGRVTATEKIDKYLSNYDLTVAPMDEVDIVVFQRTDIGYKVIINSKHLGLMHFSDVFRDLEPGDKMRGFIKEIRPGNKIDVAPGTSGYKRVATEEQRVLTLLQNNSGYLPYNDKSDPEEIYAFFGMSKKTFKMTTGALYKQRKIEFTQTGIKLLSDN